MLKRNHEGLYYVSETSGKLYFLHKGTSLGGDKEYTDDVVYIMDSGFTEENYAKWMDDEIERTDDNAEVFVDFFYGATLLEKEEYLAEYTKVIKDYVDEYESKKIYPFTKKGVTDFYIDSINNALDLIEREGRAIDIDIKVGKMHITILDTADNYERLGAFLRECQEDTVPIEREEKKMENKQRDYVVKRVIVDSCYPEVFQNIFELLNKEDVDGWNAMEFTSWLYEIATKFQDSYDGDNSKDIFFALYNRDEINMMKDSDIKYGECIEDCFMDYKNAKYYKINMTEDCALEEIVPKTETMNERILNTLEAYLLTNREVLEDYQIKDLDEQIEYMKSQIKEGK